MTSVALMSPTGAPGVTSTALALWRRWAGPAVLVEADPDGGGLAARCRWPLRPGLVEVLAAAGTQDVDEDDDGIPAPWCFGVELEPGWRVVVPAPPDAELVVAGLEEWGDALARTIADTDPGFGVVIDAGRIRPMSPVRPLVEAVRHRLVLVRPRAEDVAILVQARGRLDALGAWYPVVVGSGPYRSGEIAEAIGREVEWLPSDRPGNSRRQDAALARLGDLVARHPVDEVIP